jgi:hypothetical protein
VTMNVLVFPYQSLLPVFARDSLHSDAFGLGLLSAAAGVGSVLGSTLLARIGWLPQGRTFLIASLLTPLTVLLFAFSQQLPIAVVTLASTGIVQTGFSTMQSAVLLHGVPAQLRGRAAGWLAVAIGTGPLGVLATGAVATLIGAPLAVGCAAAAGVLVVAFQALAAPKLRGYAWRDDD